VSEGTFGWSGLFGTRLFIDPKERCRRWLSLPAAAGTN
jgi:hypothetical protein